MHEPMPELDISDRPDWLALAERVRTSQKACVLKRGDQVLAVLSPADRQPKPKRVRRPRGKPLSHDTSIWSIVGIARWNGPTDVAENKHVYLAKAYETTD